MNDFNEDVRAKFVFLEQEFYNREYGTHLPKEQLAYKRIPGV
jgi:hypothetical protein